MVVWFGSAIAGFVAQRIMFEGSNYDTPGSNKVFVPSLGERGVYVSRISGTIYNISVWVFWVCCVVGVLLFIRQRMKS
jgi:hypothetical protein